MESVSLFIITICTLLINYCEQIVCSIKLIKYNYGRQAIFESFPVWNTRSLSKTKNIF